MLKLKNYIFLVVTFFVYSLSLLFSKFASLQSEKVYFILYYILAVLIMCLYAILWQLTLKKIPLSVAFPFKSISIVYSLILGYLIFNEIITINKIFGIIIIIFGIVLVGLENDK